MFLKEKLYVSFKHQTRTFFSRRLKIGVVVHEQVGGSRQLCKIPRSMQLAATKKRKQQQLSFLQHKAGRLCKIYGHFQS